MSQTIGRQEPAPLSKLPRFHTTEADDAAFLAEGYGLKPDPWQKLFLDHAMGRDAKGRMTCTQACLSVPRQNGKNAIIEMIELYQMIVLGRRILHTAHEVKTARAAFLRIAGFFESAEYPELQEMVDFIRRANGQEEVRLLNGGSVQFGARTQGAGRGFTVDTLIMDEAQDLGDESLAALLPTISSAPSGEPQQIIVGTPPTTKSDSEVWRRLRDNAMEGKNRRSMWCEWSAPESDGPIELDDPDVWAYANPSLGIRLRAEVIEDELSAMEPGVFMRERLGMWSFAGERSVVPIEDWQMCEDRETRVLPQDIERVVLSADITPSRDAGALVAAIQTTDGKPPIVDVIDQRAGSVAWIPAKIADVVEKFGADAVIIDGYSPASSLIEDIQARGVGVTKVKVDFVCTAAERFLDSVLTHTVRQLGQGSMQLALSGARKRRVGEGRFAFGRLNSTTDISPLVAATLALNGLDTEHELSRIKYRKKTRGGAKKNYRKKVMVM